MSSFAAQFVIPSQGAAVRPGAGAPASAAPDGAFAALLSGSTATPTPRPALDRVGAVSPNASGPSGGADADFAARLRAARLEAGDAPSDAAHADGAEGATAGGLAGAGSADIVTQTAGDPAPPRPGDVVRSVAADPPAAAADRADGVVAADAPQSQPRASVPASDLGAVEQGPVHSGPAVPNSQRAARVPAGAGPEAVLSPESTARPGLQIATRAEPGAEPSLTGETAPRSAPKDGAGEDPAPAAPATKGAAEAKAGPDALKPGSGDQPDAGASPVVRGGDGAATAGPDEVEAAPRPANPAIRASAFEAQSPSGGPASPKPTGPEAQRVTRPSQAAQPVPARRDRIDPFAARRRVAS